MTLGRLIFSHGRPKRAVNHTQIRFCDSESVNAAMTDLTVSLPDSLAEEICRRAAALGTTPEEWVAAMVEDIAADLPEEAGEGADSWISR